MPIPALKSHYALSRSLRTGFRDLLQRGAARGAKAIGVNPVMNPLNWALESVARRGLVETFKAALSVVVDIGFDLRYGTDTMRWVEIHRQHAESYRATKAAPLRSLMRKLNLPKGGVFVDLGSGKGRVLLIAAQLGFNRIVGVEFSGELCEIARENVKAFSRRTQLAARIDIVKSDVASYLIESEQSVFFMYNPFDGVVMARVLTNLRSSITRFPRRIWLIYNKPAHDEAVSKSDLFSACQEFQIRGNRFKVYSN
jgi:predicted RNA methylase